MGKTQTIGAEKRKLNKIFEKIPENKKNLCKKLIENAAFMAATLDELQKEINENGPVITTVNGNGFEVMQENPAQKSYISMIGKYNQTISQLTSLLPDQKQDGVYKAGESLAKFVAGGKPVELR